MIRVSCSEYKSLIENCKYENNVGRMKSVLMYMMLEENDLKEIAKFDKIVSLSSFKITNTICNEICNVCETPLFEFRNKYDSLFKIYYCAYCNSIYFDQVKFNDFIKFACQKAKSISLFEKIKRFFIKGEK